MHDYEHLGRTNDFLVNSGDSLALTYNDRAPLVSLPVHLARDACVAASSVRGRGVSLPCFVALL